MLKPFRDICVPKVFSSKKQYIRGMSGEIILYDYHNPLLMVKLNRIWSLWKKIGMAIGLPHELIEEVEILNTNEVEKLYRIFEIFIVDPRSEVPPTLANFNKCSHLLDVAGDCFPQGYFDMIERIRRQMKADGKADLKVLFAKIIFWGAPERGKTFNTTLIGE